MLEKAGKKPGYFRFPFNCTGKDSISRTEIYQFLHDKGYIVAPFTIESSDYVYNALYSDYLKKGNDQGAQEIIEKYLDLTVDLFRYFEGVVQELYGRNIPHIFLGHTNRLHAACFEKLILKLTENGYSFISLDAALADEIYQNQDYYTGPFGISWIYRWIENSEKRKELMKKEPGSKDIEQQYIELIKQP